MFSKFLSHLFFADQCVGCKRRGVFLCDLCGKTLPPAQSVEHAFITSIFSYRDPRVRSLVRLLKFRHAHHVAKVVAPFLASSLTEFLGEEAFFIGTRPIYLVPIPLSKKRLRTRGYNQSEILARKIQECLPNIVAIKTDILYRVRDTKPQSEIKRRSLRLTNLTGCFGVKIKSESLCVIVLIDDVSTTGATLIEARKVLRKSGYTKVYALTLAH